MLYFELNFTHNILHIVDTRLFTLYKLSSLYSTYCKNFLTMGRMSKFNNFVLSCKNNFVVTNNSTTSYSRKTKLFSISFLSYLTSVINIFKVATNTFVYSICKKNCILPSSFAICKISSAGRLVSARFTRSLLHGQA